VSESTHWIIVGSLENFRTTREHGFTVQGIKSRHRKKAEQMKPGDRMTWYVTGLKAFAGTATIASEYYEDHTVIWKSTNKNRDDEDYPFRFGIEADKVLEEEAFVDAEPVARQMTHVAKWPAANWTLAFQGNVHKIDASDFAIIEEAVASAALTSV
jgi:predicted RNA-binding protein